MATHSKKVISEYEAPEGAQETGSNGRKVHPTDRPGSYKKLTAEQREKKRASYRKSRRNKEALASLWEELESVKTERDHFKERLNECEKELKETKDASWKLRNAGLEYLREASRHWSYSVDKGEDTNNNFHEPIKKSTQPRPLNHLLGSTMGSVSSTMKEQSQSITHTQASAKGDSVEPTSSSD